MYLFLFYLILFTDIINDFPFFQCRDKILQKYSFTLFDRSGPELSEELILFKNEKYFLNVCPPEKYFLVDEALRQKIVSKYK